ncbi:MAG: ABC transporter permease [Candidatus Bipolaricaulota bacterium]|nr:ABC transporter permease [Candidatus Bipolaricaulota bacterium]MBS3791973.1 ABC transporter permease [Candidatus Bipolaricaulota bacterium]
MEFLTFFFDAIRSAIDLLISFDPYLYSIIGVSLTVSLWALVLSGVLSGLIAFIVSFFRFPGCNALSLLVYTGMGLPSVIVGLFVLLLLSKNGPFGGFGLLWTPTAMIISQSVLITPLITGVMLSGLDSVEDTLVDAAKSLGANWWQRIWTIVYEARFGFITALIAGFGRAISEVGSVILVGGNIVWSNDISYTRTLTTAIVVETRKGNFDTALALGLVLLAIVLTINLFVKRLRGGGTRY